LKLKKVEICSKYETPYIKEALLLNDFQIEKNNPDFIISYGGDGTVLFCERMKAEIPKLVIKKSKICRKCDYTMKELTPILQRIQKEEYTILKEMKLEAQVNNDVLVALNEIQVRAKLPIHALRFSFSVEEKKYNDIIGDGVVVATPFGSTGYYKSTGGRQFESNIGVSFNNLNNKTIQSLVIPENSIIRITNQRGPGWVVADNNEKFIEVTDGDVCTIRKAKSEAQFINVQQFTHSG
jgi:NAD+ kinase